MNTETATTDIAFEVSETAPCAAGYQRTFFAGGTMRKPAIIGRILSYMQFDGDGEYVVGEGPDALTTTSFTTAAERVMQRLASGAAQITVTCGWPAE